MSAIGTSEAWVPVHLYWQHAQPRLRWLQFGKVHYSDPFFELTVGRYRSNAIRGVAARESSLDELVAAQNREPGPRPTGFVFHMSRCGSTLVAQMLASLTGAVVISEAPPVDAVLRSHLVNAEITDSQRILWLQALLGALGAASTGEGRRFFVKFDAWNTMELPLIHRAFPEVPWVFLVREPLEVMQSQERLRGSHMVPGVLEPQVFGWQETPELRFQEYGAEVLARICDAAASALNSCGKAAVLDYRELPAGVWTRLLAFFGIDPVPEEMARMRETLRFDAKQPGQLFDPLAAGSRPAPGPALAKAVERRLRSSYQSLFAAAITRPGEHSTDPERST